ncbi:MAG: hypothetical protein ACOCXA_09020, partial [Planctomycetota bacterium]
LLMKAGLVQVRAEDLPEGRLACDQQREDGTVVHSLTGHAICAIQRHRWIESEKRGSDCGTACEEEWIERYWRGWARSKLLEHLMGWRCWGAFGQDSFALFRRRSMVDGVEPDLLGDIAQQLARGGENLDIIAWALDQALDLDPILELLDRIDINAKRHRLLTDHIRLFI